jgi:hypothetical protein
MDKASAGHVGEAARIQAVLQILPAAKEETRAPYARVRIIILVEGPGKIISRRFNFDFLVLMFVGPALLNRGASVAGHVKPNNRWFVSQTFLRFVSPKSNHSRRGLTGLSLNSKP